MSTPWIPTVPSVVNGQDVSAQIVNPILNVLSKRTQYLFEQLAQDGGSQLLIATNIPVSVNASLEVGSVVFFDTVAGGLDLSKIGYTSSAGGNTLTPLSDSFVFGIVKTINSVGGVQTADVYLNGLVNSTGIVVNLIQDNESPNIGPLYLSKIQPGKLTSSPGGIAVFVGYAVSQDSILLNPSNECLCSFFYNYKFDIIDRPCGTPVLDTGIWSVPTPDLTILGWIGVESIPDSIIPFLPPGAAFFYNIPNSNELPNDQGITATEIQQASALASSLPPYPAGYTTFTINGLQQQVNNVDNSDGKFLINNAGLWWFGNTDGSQPWASDIQTTPIVTVVPHSSMSIPDFINLSPLANPFVDGDQVQFKGDALPPEITPDTFYYVINSAESPTRHRFQISQTLGGSVITFSNAGVNVSINWTSNIWKYYNGSSYLRPRMGLNFIRINPDYKLSAVTSLKSTSSNVTLVDGNNPANVAAAGDLQLGFNLSSNNTGVASGVNQGVKSLSYNSGTGKLDTAYQSVVTSVQQGNGIVCSTDSNGKVIISAAANGSFSGDVDQLEPVNCNLETLGLHYFSTLTDPDTTVPNGLIGKFLLPNNLPSKALQFKMLLFGKSNSAGQTISFTFDWAISGPSTVVTGSTTTNSQVDIALDSNYIANTAFVATPINMSIPASALINSAYANFRIMRVSTPYTSDIGIIGISWNIN